MQCSDAILKNYKDKKSLLPKWFFYRGLNGIPYLKGDLFTWWLVRYFQGS